MKKVLITGICGGVGRPLALKMGEKGWEVAGLCRSPDERSRKLEDVFKKNHWPLELQVCDLTNPGKIEKMVPWLKKLAPDLKAFVHLAAPRLNLQPIWRESHASFQQHWQVGTGAAFQICSYLVRPMVEKGKGRILFVLSSGVQKFPKGMSAYTVGKYSLLGLAEAIKAEYGNRIAIHTIFPSVMETPLLDDLPASAREALLKAAPEGKYAAIESTVNEIVQLLE